MAAVVYFAFCAVFVRGSPVILNPCPNNLSACYRLLGPTGNHAESPVWDADEDILYWVDVLHQDIHAMHYPTRKHAVKHIEYGQVNVVLPIANSQRLLVGVRAQVFILEWSKKTHGDEALRPLAALDQGQPSNVINEGKADPLGRFWVGTKGHQVGNEVATDRGSLYSIEYPSLNPQVELTPVTISNGMVWALNGTVMYYIDSSTKKVEAFDFDVVNGRLSKRRTVIDITEHGFKYAIPDGMTIDREGMLWVALMFGGRILRVDPNFGTILQQYKLPTSQVTSVTWGGHNLEELFVTTSGRNMEQHVLQSEPLSGSIFVLDNLGTGGIPAHKFVFVNADQY